VKGYVDPGRAYEVLRYFHELFREQFFTEKFYHNVLARGYLKLSRRTYLLGDRTVIDGTINATYRALLRSFKVIWKAFDIKSIDIFIHALAIGMFRGGRLLRNLQTGLLNNYVMFLLMGVVLILGIMLYALDRVKG
jgi:NADH-quinone oxidoreductase subunit L